MGDAAGWQAPLTSAVWCPCFPPCWVHSLLDITDAGGSVGGEFVRVLWLFREVDPVV